MQILLTSTVANHAPLHTYRNDGHGSWMRTVRAMGFELTFLSTKLARIAQVVSAVRHA